MAKRVRAAEALGVRINETDLNILRLLAGISGAGVVSVGLIAARVCRTEATVRASIRRLGECGMVELRRRYLANGGQLENEYVVTDFGRRVLALCKTDEVSSPAIAR